ncbi:MAG TPA: guanylate kinase [Egibacteraceae bacterium]|nr:guanylate kinase [Egibacteraceae bacterium]
MTDAGGRLVVVSGPGGVGKGTVVAALRRRYPTLVVSVSATTRAPRPGEVDGVHYHFVDDATFDRWVEQGRFLEWAAFAGNRYGTPWASVEAPLSEGKTVVLEIEIQGALQVRDRFPDANLIFLDPPDREALLHRLRGRGTDDEERIGQRMALADWELGQAPAFDHRVVNRTVDGAVDDIGRILDLQPESRE